jgi:hypothetical protein
LQALFSDASVAESTITDPDLYMFFNFDPVPGGESLPASQPADPAGPGLLQHVSRTVQVIHVRAALPTSGL